MLQGDQALAEQVVTELSSNPVTTFVALVVKEAEKAGDAGPDAKKDRREQAGGREVPVDDQVCR